MSVHSIPQIKALNILDFQNCKSQAKKISMVTCYDYTSATILNASNVDCILVGDSLGMVMHGFPDTLNVTVDMMAQHTQAVVKGAPNKFVIADLPFCSYRKGLSRTMDAVEKLMRTGARAVKLEGAAGNLKLIRHIVESGVPVMGHIGLTPQSLNTLGGFRVQGRGLEDAQRLMREAQELEAAGCFSIVLECVPSDLARDITAAIKIPTIGIGAGPHTSGQVLVYQDMLGMVQSFKPKFVKRFMKGFEVIKDALNAFDSEVKETVYPDVKEHCY